MENSALAPRKKTLTIVRWSKKPGRNPLVRFILWSFVGLLLCLILMINMPGLRSAGAVALFTVIFAALLTAPAVASQWSYMQGLTKRVNDTILEVTGTPGDQLSVRQFRQLTKSGERLPLQVSGVPGLTLQVVGASTLEHEAPDTWRVVVTVTLPEDGTASFDRLVAAALAAGHGTTGFA